MKYLSSAAVLATYILLPGYRYYVIGSLVAYRILNRKEPEPRVIAKGTKLHDRLTGGM